MAEDEDKERTVKDWVKLILPRVLRAAIWGFLMGGEMLIPLLMMPEIGGIFQEFLPMKYGGFTSFLAIFVGFEVAIQLFRRTIIQYALSMGRAMVSSVIMVLMTNGGVMDFAISSFQGAPLPGGVAILFTIDFRVILAIFLLLSLLSMVKNLLQAVDFISEKAEEPVIPPEIP